MQIIRISLPDGRKPLDINIGSIVERLDEFGQAREYIGRYPPTARSPDIRESRKHNIERANSAWKGFDEALSIVLLKVYEAGYKAGKRSLNYEFFCDVCDEGFNAAMDLLIHANDPTRPDCAAALKAKLNGTAAPKLHSLADI